MIIPRHWAEGRARHRDAKAQVTVRRFGWSDVSIEDAQRMADERAQQALARVRAGEAKLPRREPKVPYNGAEGVPIREEIVATHGSVVITRNSYGALCLNVADVLFADVDFDDGRWSERWAARLLLVAVVSTCIATARLHICASLGLLPLFALVGPLVVFPALRSALAWLRRNFVVDEEAHVRKRIAAFVRVHRDWRLRLYRTPVGLRVLVMQRRFAADELAVTSFFAAIGADPTYVKMCRRQQCFRARVSPKPWRIGIQSHMRPHPGVWPVHADRLAARQQWIADYEQRCAGWAACRFVEELGDGITDPQVAVVRDLHDRLARATSNLPIA